MIKFPIILSFYYFQKPKMKDVLVLADGTDGSSMERQTGGELKAAEGRYIVP